MDKDEQIRKGLKQLTKTPEGVFIALVTAIDKQQDTIEVKDLDGFQYEDVRLKSVINTNNDVVSYPAIESSVLVVKIGNDDNTLFVVGFSKIESIKGTIGVSEFEIDSDGYNISRQGESLKEVLNDQISEVGKLCDEINKIIVLPGFGTTPNIPAITAIRTTITSSIKQRLNTILK